MKTLNRCYKLIFTTIVAAISFYCFSGSAFAFDPISAAMTGSAAASGFSIGGFAGMTADAATSILNPGVTDPYNWGDLDRYGVVHHNDDNTVDITLSPDIARAGQRRLEQVNAYYGLTPGTSHLIGNYTAFGNYVLCYKSGSYWYGPNIVSLTYNSGTGTFTVAPGISISISQYSQSSSSTLYECIGTMGSVTKNGDTKVQVTTTDSKPIVFGQTSGGKYGFKWLQNGSVYQWVSLDTPGNTGITPTTDTCTISRDQNSEILDTYGRANKITIPESYVDSISYTPDSTITDISIIEELLSAILEAYEEDDIEESIYIIEPVPPGPSPTPVPGDTIADTPWTTLEEYLDSWTESFGDWTEDVFSGWTEIFGDFQDTFAGWTEIFGDFYDAVVDGFADVLDTLADILEGVLDIAEQIVNGDLDLINGFLQPFFDIFKSWFDSIKSHLSIWHYVVEWLQSIGSTFTFFFGTLSGIGTSFVLPIYAAFAGTVVIAIYRKFGR